MVSHIRFVLLLFFGGLLFAFPFATTHAETNTPSKNLNAPRLKWLAHLGGTPQNFVVDAPYLYVRIHEQIQVVDINDPTTPQVIGETDSVQPLTGLGLALVNGYLYTTNEIIDVRTPTDPTFVRNFESDFNKVVDGTRLYTLPLNYSQQPCRLRSYDVSNPAQPRLLAEEQFEPACLEITDSEENLLLLNVEVGGGNDQLILRDMSNPTAPITLATITAPETAILLDAAINGNYLYLGTYAGSNEPAFTIYDITDRTNPILVETRSEPIGRYTVEGNRLYVREVERDIVSTWDITNPQNPIRLGDYDLPQSNTFPLFIQAGYEYRMGGHGVEIRNLANLNAPTLEGTYRGWRADAGAAGGNYLYVGDTDFVADVSHLRVIDRSVPENPTVVSTLTVAGYSTRHQMVLQDNILYWGSTAGLRIINVTNPLNPLVLYEGTLITPDSVLVEGDILYALVNHGDSLPDYHLALVNIVNPAAPLLISTLDMPWMVWDSLGLHAGVLYIGSTDGALLIDVSNPTAPSVIGPVGGGIYWNAVDVEEGHLYLVDGNAGTLSIYSLATPQVPTLLATYNLSRGGENVEDGAGLYSYVEVQGNLAYIPSSSGSIRLLDVSTPQNVRFLQLYNEHLLFSPRMDAEENYLYLWGDGNGLDILQISDEPRLSIFIPQISRGP